MATLVHPDTGDYCRDQNSRLIRDPVHGLLNAVYIRLKTPQGSYWGDPTLGSRLHEIPKMKDVSRARLLAKQYTERALKDLVAAGKITGLGVTVSQPERGKLVISGQATTAAGDTLPFQHFVKVGG